MWRSGCVHMVYSERPEGAVRITARFADLRPFCPHYPGAGTARLTMCDIRPASSVLRRLAAPGGGLALFVPAAGAGCRIGPHHPIGAAIEALAEYRSLPLGWKAGTAALRERRCRAARVPMSPGQGLDPAEPVNVPAVDW
jgi:hypothetical protein